MRFALRFLVVLASTVHVSGCGRTQEAFRTVQMCVQSDEGIAELKRLMHLTARSENLEFIDNSAHAASGLQLTAQNEADRRAAIYAIDVHIEGDGGMGTTASNLGLPRYQIGLGFTEGNDPAKAHQLADQLVSALSQRWKVETLAPGKGILPMKSCGT